jgi:hypothetical protein
MVYFTHGEVRYVGYSNMWEVYIYSSDGRYYTDLGWPVLGNGRAHHHHVFARNRSGAERKINRLIRKAERKFN